MIKNKIITICAVSLFFLVASSTIAAVDIHNIELNYGRYWWAGDPESKPYDLWCTVTGTGISGITKTPPGGNPVALDNWFGDTWGFGSDNFLTKAGLYAAYPSGLYEFNINAGEDSVTINHNPFEPIGFPNITYPTDNATNVPLDPTITWNSCVDWGDGLILALWDETGGGGQLEWLNIADTSWNPGPLESGHEYELEAAVIDGSTSQPYNGTTFKGDAFDYYNLFLYENTIQFTTSGTAAAPYSFYLDRFEISGQVSKSDEFNDGVVEPWVIHDPTVAESGGFVSFSSPGTIEGGVLDGFPYLNEMSFIGSGYPSPFVVENGDGNFTGISRWDPIIPGVNQWYEMQVGYELQEEPHEAIDISVGVANWDSEFADILGIPSGLGISFYLSGDSLVWKHILISEDDLTNANAILLKLDFFDDTDEFRAGFSLDGGANYQYFPELIGWDQPTPGHYEWYFSGQAIELQAIPTPHSADTNSDNVISILEILAYIDQWAVGDVTMLEVLEGIDLWAAGSYYWDPADGKFKPGEKP